VEEADIADAAEDVAFGLQTALAQNPELAEKHPELAAVADKARAEEIKTRANSLFGKKQYKESIEEYDKALELDRTNHVVYSNRAAALSWGSLSRRWRALVRASSVPGGSDTPKDISDWVWRCSRWAGPRRVCFT